MPHCDAMGATTVYELLEARFSPAARRAAGAMYLVGRVFASGARLYLAAIAVSMILFLDVAPEHIIIASFVLLVFGLAFTFMGGLNSVIWRSEEHTSELQSLMRISYAVFCLKTKIHTSRQ